MSEIIEKTYNFLDVLDNSDLIKNLTKYRDKLLKNNDVLLKVKEINSEEDIENKVLLKKELYKNNDYVMYMKYYNELSFIVLKINNRFARYTKTTKHNCY